MRCQNKSPTPQIYFCLFFFIDGTKVLKRIKSIEFFQDSNIQPGDKQITDGFIRPLFCCLNNG